MTLVGFEYLGFGPTGEGPPKLVILLHGYGRNAHYMEKMAEEACLALPGATILCPHAPEPLDHSRFEGSKTNFFRALPEDVTAGDDGYDAAMLRQWFAIEGDIEQLFQRMQPAAARLNAFIDMQRDIAGLKDRDIGLMGFSQGGGLALYAGMTRAQELGCVVCHSAIALEGMRTMVASTPPVYFIYGTRDNEFSVSAYAHSLGWIQKLTGNRATAAVVEGMGHYTNAESRKLCAAYIKNKLFV